MAILHTHRQTMTYIERARVFVDGDRVVYSIAESSVTKSWNVPSANMAFLLLGNGCSITTAAARVLADDGVSVGHCGGGGMPLFMAPMSDYRPTEIFQRWIQFWPDVNARLTVAKFLAAQRCEAIERAAETGPSSHVFADAMLSRPLQTFRKKLIGAADVATLMGYEGAFTKEMYAVISQVTGANWTVRDNTQKRQGKDVANKFLDDGNYVAYGIASVALWCLGLTPQLPVTHGQHRAGGLVFDIADVIKDAYVLPCAFEAAAAGVRPGAAFRQTLVRWFDDAKVLDHLLDVIRQAADVGFETIRRPSSDLPPNSALPRSPLVSVTPESAAPIVGLTAGSF